MYNICALSAQVSIVGSEISTELRSFRYSLGSYSLGLPILEPGIYSLEWDPTIWDPEIRNPTVSGYRFWSWGRSRLNMILQSGILQSGILQSRATDFGAGDVVA